MPEVNWSTATTFHVSALRVGTFSAYTTGAMGTTDVVPAMSASTVALSTASTVGVTAFGFVSSATFTSHVAHINHLTDDVASLFKLVNGIVDKLKGT